MASTFFDARKLYYLRCICRLQGSTALLWASSGGSLEVVEWLVKEAGADAGHRNKVSHSLVTAILSQHQPAVWTDMTSLDVCTVKCLD